MIYFNIADFIINAPVNFILFKSKKEYKEIKVVFKKYNLWGNSQLVNIIVIEKLLNAGEIDKNLAELIFKTYFNYLKITRVEAKERAFFTYREKIFNKY